MTKGDFAGDHLARKTICYLLVIELASLYIALILGVLRAAPIAFLLAILMLVLFVGVFAWLYFRFRAFPIVREKAALRKKAGDLRSKIGLEGYKICEANQRRARLTQAERQELAQALEILQKAYIQNGLTNARLDSARIPGIPPKLEERLAAHHILTAADIDSNVSSIPGFEGEKSQALLSWQRSIHDELVRTQPAALPADTIHAIRRKFQKRHAENNLAEATVKKNTLAYEAELRSVRQRLKELPRVNFAAYLSSMLASQKDLYSYTDEYANHHIHSHDHLYSYH